MRELEKGCVIVGAGQAGLRCALSLREFGYDRPITMIGTEPHVPYERPPLSKAMLVGAFDALAPRLTSPDELRDQRIDFRPAATIVGLDASERSVTLGDGATMVASSVVLATGMRARTLPLPGADADNVVTLRSMDDAQRLNGALRQLRRVVIIGGGFVGLEVAASARHLGCDVVVLEAAPRCLMRSVSDLVAGWLVATHTERGVAFRYGVTVSAIAVEDGRASGVVTSAGATIPADLVVVAVGGTPNDELARAAGIRCQDGIVVDDAGATSAPEIFAAGDVARHALLCGAPMVRLESWQNAEQQARNVAARITGRPLQAFVPWFWTDQYEHNVQTLGLSAASADESDDIVVRGDPASGRFARFVVREGRLVAAELINSGRLRRGATAAIESGRPISLDTLADPTNDLRATARASGA